MIEKLGGGKKAPEKSPVDFESIEQTPIATYAIVTAFEYGARAEDLGVILDAIVPHLLSGKEWAAKPLYDHMSHIKRRSGTERAEEKTGAVDVYVAYLKQKFSIGTNPTDIPPDIATQIRGRIQECLRGIIPPQYWMKDDKLRALAIPLLAELQQNRIIKYKDVAAALNEELPSCITARNLEYQVNARGGVSSCVKTIGEFPTPLDDELIIWGKKTCDEFLRKNSDRLGTKIGRPAEWKENPEMSALVAACIMLNLGYGEAEGVLTALGLEMKRGTFKKVRAGLISKGEKEAPEGTDLNAYAAMQLHPNLSDELFATSCNRINDALAAYNAQSERNLAIKSETLRDPRIAAFIAVLLQDTDLSADIIIALMKERFGEEVHRDTLYGKVRNQGARNKVADSLIQATQPSQENLEEALNLVPWAIERAEVLHQTAQTAGRKKAVATAAKHRAEREESDRALQTRIAELNVTDNTSIRDLLKFISGHGRTISPLYNLAQLSLARSISPEGVGDMVPSVVITLNFFSPKDASESENECRVLEEAFQALADHARAGRENMLTEALRTGGFGGFSLRKIVRTTVYGGYVYKPRHVASFFLKKTKGEVQK